MSSPRPSERPPWSLTIREAADLIRTRRLAPSELVASSLSRLEAVEPHLRAFVVVDDEGAKATALDRDAEVAAGRWRGPLHGVPVAIKDMIDVAGFPTRRGSAAFHDAPAASDDATVVARLRTAGAVVVGKTTTHEFALGAMTPPTRNPWDLERSPGGSSGGSAAAVASGAVLGALGTDTAGSVRMPAALCGIVGIKPTYGLVSTDGVVPLSWSLDCVGPLARTVDDAAILLRELVDRSDDDRPIRDQLEVGSSGSVAGLRIGIVHELFLEGVEAHVAEAVVLARDLLSSEGATCVDVPMPEIRDAMDIAFGITRAEYGSLYEETLRTRSDLITDRIRSLLEDAMHHPAVAYLRAQRRQAAFRQRLEDLSRTHGLDALLSPTVPVTAIRTDQSAVAIDGRDQIAALWLIRNTIPFNLTGQPAITVPAGPTRTLPIGLQVAAPRFAEPLALRICRVLERAAGTARGFREPTALAALSSASSR